tara:strand:+ start:936 stop:1565 length:630 start_codon:yes stop_codon:yes gene_type:complete
MKRISHNPGVVEWSGENPGIYLKEDIDSDFYSVLALFFRVVLSPYGRGNAAILLAEPEKALGWPEVPNLIMTDNQRLMKWILEGWVRNMPTFRNKSGLDGMSWLDCASVEKNAGDIKKKYSEKLRGSGVELEFIWRNMGPPTPIEVTKENSATKLHEMYSVFLEAKSAEIKLNGTNLKGEVSHRRFFGREMSTAFLAFSETWISPGVFN